MLVHPVTKLDSVLRGPWRGVAWSTDHPVALPSHPTPLNASCLAFPVRGKHQLTDFLNCGDHKYFWTRFNDDIRFFKFMNLFLIDTSPVHEPPEWYVSTSNLKREL